MLVIASDLLAMMTGAPTARIATQPGTVRVRRRVVPVVPGRNAAPRFPRQSRGLSIASGYFTYPFILKCSIASPVLLNTFVAVSVMNGLGIPLQAQTT